MRYKIIYLVLIICLKITESQEIETNVNTGTSIREKIRAVMLSTEYFHIFRVCHNYAFDDYFIVISNLQIHSHRSRLSDFLMKQKSPSQLENMKILSICSGSVASCVFY